jgi:hypothetical protein
MSTDISVITEVSRKTLTLAHITNSMVQDQADFEKRDAERHEDRA